MRKHQIKLQIFLGVLSICLSGNRVFATTVKHLYAAEVPIASQSPADEQQAIQVALQNVLIKVSGSSKILENPEIQKLSQDARQLMQAYHYVRQAGGAEPFIFKVQFQSKPITDVLGKIKALWVAQRPLLLVWFGVKMDGAINLITADSESSVDNALLEALQQSASRRAIPILLPVVDINTMDQVRGSDVWQMRLPNIQSASRPYHPEAILVMRMEPSREAIWHGQATVVYNSQSAAFQAEGATAKAVVENLVDQVIDYISEHAKRSQSVQITKIDMLIDNINSIQDYGKLLKHLQSLNSISDVEVTQVKPHQVALQVSATGGDNELIKELSADPVFAVVELPKQVMSNALLHYRWLR